MEERENEEESVQNRQRVMLPGDVACNDAGEGEGKCGCNCHV